MLMSNMTNRICRVRVSSACRPKADGGLHGRLTSNAECPDAPGRWRASPEGPRPRFLVGLHLIQFDHWALRWLYFFAGLSGCILIATGFLYWLETRRTKHEKMGLRGVRLVEGLALGSVTGILVATLAFFVVNRLLPLGFEFGGTERPALEVWVFYLVWIGTFAHAWSRPGRAWLEQCWLIAALSVLAVVLNAVTTGDHLVRSFSEGLWPVFYMDLLLLVGAVVALLAARRLQEKPAAPVKAPVKATAKAMAKPKAKAAPARPAARPAASAGNGAPPASAPAPKEVPDDE